MKAYSAAVHSAAERFTLPDFPAGGKQTWDHFINLRSRCGSEADDKPIQYSEIKAYAEMTDRRLPAWEVDLIIKMDTAFRDVARKPATSPPTAKAKEDTKKAATASLLELFKDAPRI